MKIRSKLILAFLTISLSTLLLSNLLSYSSYKKGLVKAIVNQLESVASIQQSRIEAIASQNLERLNLVASRTQLRISLEKFIQTHDPAHRQKMHKILFDAKRSIRDFNSISISTMEGVIVASTDSAKIEENVAGEKSFLRGQQGRNVDLFFIDDTSMNLSVALCAPLFLDEKPIGVIIIESSVDNLLSSIGDYTGLGDTGETLLAAQDTQGNTVFITPTRFNQNAALKLIIPKEKTSLPITQAFTKHRLVLENAVDYRGEKVLAATGYVQDMEWAIVVKTDKAEALKPLRDMQSMLLVIIAASVLLVVIVSLYVAKGFTLPVVKLTEVTRKISQGNFTEIADETSKDELGILAKSFNFMTSNLLQVKKNLEITVDQLHSEAQEHLLSEETLKISQERLQLTVEGAELGMWDWDMQTNEVYFNPQYFSMLGYGPAELPHTFATWENLLHPEDREQAKNTIFSSFSTKPAKWALEFRLRAKNGDYVWIFSRGTIVSYSKDGTPLRATGTHLNITERKQQEKLLAEITEQQADLKRLESLKTMAGAIAHRFNNSMMAVTGNLDLLTPKLPSDSKEKELASHALQAARGASKIGSMMLTYVGQEQQKLQTTSLPELAKESVAELKSQFLPSIALEFIQPSVPSSCSVDRQQIKDVIISIITNAIESLHDEAGTLEISFGTDYFTTESLPLPFQDDDLKNGMYTFCQVQDSGLGINQEDLSRIFDPFFSTKFVGRGLGLALTVGIMRSHHGAVTIANTSSSGTTVRILLPVEKESPQQATPPMNKKSIAHFSGDILLADDEEVVLAVGQKMLETLGFNVHVAVNGKEAVELVRKQDIDYCAVVLDISMPVMDGIEALGIIKTIDGNLPVLLSSGYAVEDFPSLDGPACKPDDFLQKPFQLSDMQKIFGNILS